MKSDTSALSAVTNALNLGSSVVQTATSAMSSVNTILKQLKADLVTAHDGRRRQDPGAERHQRSAVEPQEHHRFGRASTRSTSWTVRPPPPTSCLRSPRTNSGGTQGNDLGTIAGRYHQHRPGGRLLVRRTARRPRCLSRPLPARRVIRRATPPRPTAPRTAAAGYYAADSLLAFNITGASSTDLSQLSSAIGRGHLQCHRSLRPARHLHDHDQQPADPSSPPCRMRSPAAWAALWDADMNQASTRPERLADPAAARRAGSVDREPEQPADPEAVPVSPDLIR